MLDAALSRRDPGILQVTAFPSAGDSGSKLVDDLARSFHSASIVPTSSQVHVFEIAPLRWWVASGGGQMPSVNNLDKSAATVVDVSSSRVLLQVRHARWADVIVKGCGIDLTVPPFVSRRYAMTALGRFNVLLHAPQAEDACEIYVGRSLAGSLYSWLTDALTEFESE